MSQQQNNQVADVGEHGLKKHDIKVSTVVFMIFCLVASELGSVRPQEGGYYKWVQEAFGEFWGFQAGWW